MKSELPKKGQKIIVEIEDLSSKGEGVAKVRDYIIFVPETIPGDKVEAEIISVKSSYGRALPLRIIEPSLQRENPDCSIYDKCGGCQLQHLNYEEQLKYKKNFVKDALQRIGKIENLKVEDTLPSPERFLYRNKAQVPVGQDSKGRTVTGFYARASHNIVDCDNCLIQHPSSTKIINSTKEALKLFNVPIYNEKKHNGGVRHLLSRVGLHSGQVMLVVVTQKKEVAGLKEAMNHLFDNKENNLTTIVQNINPKRSNTILGDESITLKGSGKIAEKIGNISFNISPTSFFQVNTAQTENLYRLAMEAAALKGSETVLDLYCGIGTIALYLAHQAGQVIGIESHPQAIIDAKENAQLNNIDNVEFITGKAEKEIDNIIKRNLKPAVIIIDPPRKGCHPDLLAAMKKASPEKIIYISCNPATLARDLKIFTEDDNYKVKYVQPVDMFPHTAHVETVVLMSRVEK